MNRRERQQCSLSATQLGVERAVVLPAPASGMHCGGALRFLAHLDPVRIKGIIVLAASTTGLHFRGAAWFRAQPKRPMLEAEPVRFGRDGAVWCLARPNCLWATAVLPAEVACVRLGGALRMNAQRPRGTPAMLATEAACVRVGGAAVHGTHPAPAPTRRTTTRDSDPAQNS